MAEEIVLGKLVIDTSDLASAMADSKKAIIDLEVEQKKLKKDTDNLSGANEEQLKTFIANEAELKKLKAEYSANQKSVLELTKAQTGLDSALKAQVKTQNGAIENTKALTAARKQIDATTTEGAKAIADINAKINANNEFVRVNGSEQEKAATITGNYRQALFNLGGAFGGATQTAIGFVQKGKEITGALGEVNNAVVTTFKSVVGFGNASKVAAVQANEMAVTNTVASTATEGLAVAEETATVATSGLNVAMGILLAPITLIVAAVGLVIFLFKDLDPLLDKIGQGMAAVGAVVDVLRQSVLAFVDGGKSLTESFGGMGDAMAKAAKEAADLKAAQQDLADVQRSQEVANAKASQQYDELILKSKNRTLTEKERIAFLNQAQAIEEANFKQRAALSQAELDNAVKAASIKGNLSEQERANLKKNTLAYGNYLLNTGRITEEQLNAIKKAELGKIEIQAENTKRLEKSQNAEDKLAEDAEKKRAENAAKNKAASDKARAAELKNAQNRIDILKLESTQSDLTTEQRITNAEKIFKLENELAKKALSGSDEQKKLLANRQELSSSILAIAEDQINKEVELQKKSFGENAAADQEALADQIESANTLAKAQQLLLDKALLTEKDYNVELVKINEAKNESIAVANKSFDDAEKVRQETELANTRALEEVAHQIRLQDIADRGISESEIKTAILEEDYRNDLLLLEQNLADKSISQEVYNQKRILSDKKYAAATKDIDKQVAATKRTAQIGIVSDAIGAAQAIFGESKALAVASALMNTYQGITAELSTKAITPYEIGLKVANVALVAASGFAAVKNILKTDKGSSSTDSGAAKVTTSGTQSFVNTAQTETIARVSEAPKDNTPLLQPPILILETLLEAQNNLAVKVGSE